MNIRSYTIEGRVCLGYEFNGTIYVLSWIGQQGNCVDVTGKAKAKWF